MTVHFIEGTMAPPSAALAASLFKSNPALAADASVSEVWRPTVYNDPEAASTFNLFIFSNGFTGKVNLVKAPPGDSNMSDTWFTPVESYALQFQWQLKSGEAVVQTIQEPENNISYRLVANGPNPSGLHYRFSL
jgi:hypothetical protein